ncbi:SLC13 family permease [Actinophytocola sediminis]
MAAQITALLVLALAFLIATVRPVHLGALALAAALAVGTGLAGLEVKDILAGFPVDILLLLLGVTLLFGIARANDTLDWLIDRSLRLIGNRTTLLPVLFFVLSAGIASLGSPLAAIVLIPVSVSFAGRNRLSPVVLALATTTGGSAGAFAPTSLFGLITAGTARGSGIDFDGLFLFGAALAVNLVLFVGSWMLFGKYLVKESQELEEPDGGAPSSGPSADVEPDPLPAANGTVTATATATRVTAPVITAPTKLNAYQLATVVSLLLLVCSVIGLAFFGVDLHVGATALGLSVLLMLAFTKETADAVKRVDWSTILLVGGITTYVGVLDHMGAVKSVADLGTKISSPLLAAFALCVCGALISAVGSTTALLAIIIPLALPLVEAGGVPAVGVICALALSSSLVDISPLSTVGATAVGAVDERIRPQVRRFLFQWGFSMVLIGPVLLCAFLVLPGYLAG